MAPRRGRFSLGCSSPSDEVSGDNMKVSFTLMFALSGYVPFAAIVLAQGRGGSPMPLARILPSDKKFDPHDLAGIWTRNSSRLGYGGGGTCPDCGDRGFGNDVPPFTPLGEKMFDANKPSYGRNLGTPDAAAHPEEHIGRRRAVPPS